MKSNSDRVLPARRTIGSIVRQSPQGKDRNQSIQNATAAGTSRANSPKNDGNNNGSKITLCDICAQSLPGPERERIYAFGRCDHHVCYVCSARLRAICDQHECPICREKLDKVVFSATDTKPFHTHDLQSYRCDDKHGIYFEDDKIRAAFDKLLTIQCLECLKRVDTQTTPTKEADNTKQVTPDTDSSKNLAGSGSSANAMIGMASINKTSKGQFPSVQKLKHHIEFAHKLRLCDLCLTHNKLFPFEYSYYDYESLKNHTQKGEPNTSHRGHPRCKLCHNIFFNLDELLMHMSREHYHCHLCGRHNTTQHIYFNDYPSLRNHFKTKHFLCERDNCRHEQFTSAFDTQVDYQLHLVQVHDTSTNLSRGEARQHRTITLDSVSVRQSSHQDVEPTNGTIVRTGILATANNPRRQIPESLRAQIIQQRLPSRSEFPALGNAPSSLQHGSRLHGPDEAGPSRVSFVRSIGGYTRPPEQLNEMDFPPLPEQPKKGKKSKPKKATAKPQTTSSQQEMTLDQLISSSLNISRNQRGTNKVGKNTKPKPIKIQL